MKCDSQVKILLVEDEMVLAMTEKMKLTEKNYSVVIQHSGETAIAFMDKNPEIDIILMDIDLGRGINGIETAKLILKNRDIPIVFVTSQIENDFFSSIENIHYYGYVIKNLNVNVLDASIKQALKFFNAHQRDQMTAKRAEVLIREGYQRLNNNLHTVYTMLTLRASSAFDDISGRVMYMMQLCGKLSSIPHVDTVSDTGFMSSLIDDILASLPGTEKLRIVKEIESFELDVSQMRLLGLIANELVTNAVKHAYPHKDDKDLTISVKNKNGSAVMTISDNGIGLSNAADYSGSFGKGLTLVRDLSDLLRGQMRIEEKGGTKVALEFPPFA